MDDIGGRVGSSDWYKERANLVLDLLSDLYSLSNSILVGTSGPSFCPTLYYLLTI